MPSSLLATLAPSVTTGVRIMGKYLIAWVLGVPAVLLVGIYAVTHLL